MSSVRKIDVVKNTVPMPPVTESLDSRSSSLLEEIVYTFVAAGKPVGSRTISKLWSGSISPATVRNVMSDLEELGYLCQPHPSAGRVPTDKGYRFYVNRLLKRQKRGRSALLSIPKAWKGKGNKESVLPKASLLLAELSHCVGIVAPPDPYGAFLQHIEFVKVSSDKVLVVLVTAGGAVQNTLVPLYEPFTSDELRKMSRFLTVEFSGMTLRAMRTRLMKSMSDERARYDALFRESMALGRRCLETAREQDDVYLEGKANLFSEKDLKIDGMKAIFEAFEQKSHILKILNSCLSGEGITVIIGNENPDESLQNYSFILSSYRVSSQEKGALGIIGPTRMEYSKMLDTVRKVAAWVESKKTGSEE